MIFKIATTSILAAVIQLTSHAAQAQTATPATGAGTPATAGAPMSREQRKAETAAANRAGQLTPAGEGPVAPAPSKTSTMSREQRKAQAKADQKAGNMVAAGQGPIAPPPSKTSTMTREQRKAQAKADQKAGKMVPAGEGPGN